MNLDRLCDYFAENFEQLGELGASVSIWKGDVEVLSLAGGWCDREKTSPWTAETPVLFWSATKGLTSACVLRILAERQIDPITTRVSEVWPEFGQAGKASVTIAELMSHRAGLPALTTVVDVWDYQGVVAALAAEAPRWPVGRGHGYHPRTFGFLMDELVRRLTGRSIREYWLETFALPLDLDLWIGVPEEQLNRIAPVFPARTGPPPGDGFYAQFFNAGSLTAQAFASPKGLFSPGAMNKPEALASGFPGFGGVGTARSLAKFYSVLAAGGSSGKQQFLPQGALAYMTTTLTQGPDRILQIETAFSCGFMRDPVDADGRKKRTSFGPSHSAFGHPGAGGSHAFADPASGFGFAYVMNQMEPGVLPNARSLKLIDALYE